MKFGDREDGAGVLHAVNEGGKWVFTGWENLDPGAECSVLANADWKLPAPMTWGEPMIEVLCAVETCIL